jgi:hypothetical protein
MGTKPGRDDGRCFREGPKLGAKADDTSVGSRFLMRIICRLLVPGYSKALTLFYDLNSNSSWQSQL